VWLNRGRARLALDDAAGALADYERELALHPRSLSALMLRAELRERLGEVEAAVVDLRRVLELAPPGSPAAQDARAALTRLGAGAR
jgi:predicted TPR repeat methyltransferase